MMKSNQNRIPHAGLTLAILCLAGSLAAAPCLAGQLSAGLPTGDETDPIEEAFIAPLPDIDTFMQIGWSGDPRISADGKTIYLTSGMPGVNQLFRMLPGGWPYQLTVFPDGVDYYTISPNDRWVIIGASVGGNEQSQLLLMDGKTGALKQLTDAPETRFIQPIWARDGRSIYYPSNEANGRDFYIYSRVLPDGEPQVVYESPSYNIASDLDKAGRRLTLIEYRSSQDTDILLIDLETKEVTNLTEHEGDKYYVGGVFSADEQSIFILTSDNAQGLLKPAMMNLETRKITFPFKGDSPWELEEGELSPDRRYTALVYNEEGYGRLSIFDIEKGKEMPVPELDGIVSSVSLSNTHEITFGFSSPTQSPDVWRWNWDTRELKRVTFSTYAGVDPAVFTDPKLIHYKSFDGLEIPAFLYLPPHYKGGPIPFIMDMHGGPEGQFRPHFNRHFTYLMQHGFGLLAPNVRGSSGYGREFSMMDDYKKRMDSVKDMGAGAQWLIDNGYTKPEMLGVKGGSYGGYMTLAALTTYPDLFAAGCDEVGIADFETFLKNTADYRRHLREAEYGPLSDPEFLHEISPMTHVDRIKGALLVIHGENDPRVPVGEARQIAKALSDRGAPVDTLIFSDEGHGVGKRENRLILYRKMVDFFLMHLKSGMTP
ncbi:MAG: S9 family peptidase [Candidatus Eisenbacteria bacterium]|uniref:S9 family peptidase n=1 Tax=Eiseniibacteriota bacterium TaxID=2212470 RepID=A0A948RW84_UNCEI|nr:S9 family peptidase [Candidatus Eisenbacteria bacterium]MBU1950247.1 S9 family peptidase [Candidatus Eisenbacteria bacterium]MBU2690703.1 S9 family peptidase [Candidatus Eisenbacteria bacterium]